MIQKHIYYSSERLSIGLWGSEVISLLISLYCYILFTNFLWSIQKIYNLTNLQMLSPAFTCANAIGNLWNICLGGNTLRTLHWVSFLIRNILLSRALITFCLPLRNLFALRTFSSSLLGAVMITCNHLPFFKIF